MSAYWLYLAEASVSLPILCAKRLKTDGGMELARGAEPGSDFIADCASCYEADQIEDLFELAVPFTDKQFEADLLALLRDNITLNELYEAVSHRHFINVGLALFAERPAVCFRLAVMRACLPFEYQRTLFCLWLVIFESHLSDREQDDFEALFLSALCHDLGLLDVNPHFTRLDHDPRSTKDDGEGYYSHVYFGTRFLEQHANVSESVLRGVKQHHEVMDGTGYPEGISGNQLAEYGQHIHLYDTLFSIFQKNYRPLNKCLADLKPVIEINAVTHFGASAVRLLELLSRATRSSEVFFSESEFPRIQMETDNMGVYIEKSMAIIQEFTGNVGFRHDERPLFALQNSFIHISLAYYKLRTLHDQVKTADALSEQGEYQRLARVVEDNFLSLREIIYHINKFLFRLRLYTCRVQDERISEHARSTVIRLSKLTINLIH